MNKGIIFICITFISGCSDRSGPEWIPGQEIQPDSPPGRIHGDERSPNERYLDCVREANSKTQRSNCSTQSHVPDKEYIGIEMPLRF